MCTPLTTGGHVCRRLSDEQFWRRYFALVEHLLGDEEDDSVQHTPHTAPSHRSHQTSRSGTSAWEDLGQSPIPAPGSSPSLRKAQGDAELDDYMKVCPWPAPLLASCRCCYVQPGMHTGRLCGARQLSQPLVLGAARLAVSTLRDTYGTCAGHAG